MSRRKRRHDSSKSACSRTTDSEVSAFAVSAFDATDGTSNLLDSDDERVDIDPDLPVGIVVFESPAVIKQPIGVLARRGSMMTSDRRQALQVFVVELADLRGAKLADRTLDALARQVVASAHFEGKCDKVHQVANAAAGIAHEQSSVCRTRHGAGWKEACIRDRPAPRKARGSRAGGEESSHAPRSRRRSSEGSGPGCAIASEPFSRDSPPP